jgi:hypothetical protein
MKEILEGQKKWMYSIYTGILLVILFNPLTFKLTHTIFCCIMNKNRTPTIFGFILHLIVFVLILRWMMEWNI